MRHLHPPVTERRLPGRWWMLRALALGFVLGLPASPVAAKEAIATLALESFLKELKTLTASFRQDVYDEAGALIETSRGTLSVQRPGRFSWVYSEPYRQTIVSDGKTLWLYDEDLAQVTVNSVGTGMAGSAAALLGDEIDLNTAYVLSETGEREGLHWVNLTPRAEETQYTGVSIGLRDGVLASMRLTDNLGQTTALSFEALRRNPQLASDLFTFTVPAGVDVVTGSGEPAP